MATLSSPRSVCNVRVESPEWKLPAGAQPENGFTIPRGTVVFFSGNDIHVGNNALTASTATGGLGVGVFAEAITKSQRVPAGAPKPAGIQKPRKRRRYNGHVAPDIAVPVTFYGLDLLFSPEPHDGFAPGDSVFAASSLVGSNSSYVLTKAPLPLSGVSVRHLGTATASAEPRTHLIEVFVSPTTNTVNFSDENFLKQVGTAYKVMNEESLITQVINAITSRLNSISLLASDDEAGKVAQRIKQQNTLAPQNDPERTRLNKGWRAVRDATKIDKVQIKAIATDLATNVQKAVKGNFKLNVTPERQRAVNAAIASVNPGPATATQLIRAVQRLKRYQNKESDNQEDAQNNIKFAANHFENILTGLNEYYTNALKIAQNTTFQ